MGNFFENVGRAVEKGAQDLGKAAEKGAQDLGTAAEKGVQDVGKTAEKAVQDTGNALEKAAQDTGNTLEKAAHDLGRTLGKAAHDTVDQVGRSYGDVVELAEASYHFIENQVEGYQKLIADASKRVEEGKLIDAVWGVMTDPTRIAEQSTADAVMESSVLNTLAASGAAVYGGPGGAAAYAAWYTYKATGSLEAAVRAGAIAWATTTAGTATRGIQGNTLDAAAKRTLASAAIGGAAVAASGGSDEQVLAAFGRGATVGAAGEAYKSVTKQTLEGKPPTKGAVLKDDPSVRAAYKTLDNGNLDVTSMPRDISHVGLSTGEISPGYLGITETSPIMQDLGKLPYMNDMAYFHDQWVAVTGMQGIAVQVTILPAIALTGMGSAGAQNNAGTGAVVDRQKEGQGG